LTGEGDDVTEASIVAAPRARTDVHPGQLVALVAGGAVALLTMQAFAASRLELTFDEAYYTLWSRALAFGYLDHPPMVAYFIRASTTLLGGSEFGVRALSLALVGALPALIAYIAWRLFHSVETAAIAVLMWIASPLVMAGAAFATPDAALVVFWTLGLAALTELWRTAKTRWFIAMGLALGLMALSKFTAAFFAAGAALALVTTPSLRRSLRSPAPWAALILAAAIFSPFVLWNAGHGWATFVKQGGRAAANGFAPFYLVEFIGAQILLMNPLAFPAVAAAVAGVSWRAPAGPRSAEEARRLLVSTIAPAVIYFVIHALHDRVEGNWLAPILPAGAILTGDWVERARGAGAGFERVASRAALWAAPLAFAVMALAFFQTLTGILPLGAADPTERLEGFRDLARGVDARARAEGARFVLAQGYALASLLRYYGDVTIHVVQREERIRWIFEPSPPESLFASPGLAIIQSGARFEFMLRERFRSVEPAGTLERRRAGKPIETYQLFRVAEPCAAVLEAPDPIAKPDFEQKCQ
jgi:Dolichyl-phosphate-mannose-protein mannosyltransferase